MRALLLIGCVAACGSRAKDKAAPSPIPEAPPVATGSAAAELKAVPNPLMPPCASGWCQLPEFAPVHDAQWVAIGAGPDALYVAGWVSANDDTQVGGGSRIVVERWDGHAWQLVQPGRGEFSELARGDAFYALGGAGAVWRLEGGTWHREDAGTPEAFHIAGDPVARQTWIATGSTEVLHRDANGWQHKSTDLAELTAITVAHDGSVFIAGTDKANKPWLERLQNGAFTRVTALPQPGRQLIVREHDHIDVIGVDGTVRSWSSSGVFEEIGQAQLAARAGSGVVYVGTAPLKDPTWERLQLDLDAGLPFIGLDAYDGAAWALQKYGSVYYRSFPRDPLEPHVAPLPVFAGETFEVAATHGAIRVQLEPPAGYRRDGSVLTNGTTKVTLTVVEGDALANEPGELVSVVQKAFGDNRVQLTTVRINGALVRRFRCQVPVPGARATIRLAAEGDFDNAALEQLCQSATVGG
jgi:hypothetical protein